MGHTRSRSLREATLEHPSFTLIVTVVFLTLPYIKWFGVGMPTDVQPYPFAVAVLVILLNWRYSTRRDGAIAALVLFAIALSVLQVIAEPAAIAKSARGLYGYLTIGFLIWGWVLLIRRYGSSRIQIALKTSFWLWVGVGVAQLFIPTFGDFWRDKLVSTDDRGTLSLATEPAYFAFAVTLLALTIYVLGGPYRYLLYATATVILVAQSTVGLVYVAVMLIVFTPARMSRKILVAGLALLVWVLATALLPDSRITHGTRMLIADPWNQIYSDRSTGLRYISVAYPVRAFLDSFGAPHGLNVWNKVAAYYHREFGGNFHWAYLENTTSSGRVLSIHGQLLLELGIFALIYYVLLWRVIRGSAYALRIGLLLFVMFFNGLTLNSPFFALLLAAAFTDPERMTSAARAGDIPSYEASTERGLRRSARPMQRETRPARRTS